MQDGVSVMLTSASIKLLLKHCNSLEGLAPNSDSLTGQFKTLLQQQLLDRLLASTEPLRQLMMMMTTCTIRRMKLLCVLAHVHVPRLFCSDLVQQVVHFASAIAFKVIWNASEYKMLCVCSRGESTSGNNTSHIICATACCMRANPRWFIITRFILSHPPSNRLCCYTSTALGITTGLPLALDQP